MANSFAWYICPYDLTFFSSGRTLRTPAISRHIPAVPNPDTADWDEAEILGNHILVKVFAPAAQHAVIQADPDFLRIPGGVSVPLLLRPLVQSKLEALGYTTAEITETNFLVLELLRMLTTACHTVLGRTATNDGLRLGVRRPSPKTFAHIEARLPG